MWGGGGVVMKDLNIPLIHPSICQNPNNWPSITHTSLICNPLLSWSSALLSICMAAKQPGKSPGLFEAVLRAFGPKKQDSADEHRKVNTAVPFSLFLPYPLPPSPSPSFFFLFISLSLSFFHLRCHVYLSSFPFAPAFYTSYLLLCNYLISKSIFSFFFFTDLWLFLPGHRPRCTGKSTKQSIHRGSAPGGPWQYRTAHRCSRW